MNFKNINALLQNYMFRNKINILQRNLGKRIKQSEHANATFDCGFFDIDIRLIKLIFNFMLLFVFAILMQVNLSLK